MWNRVRADEGTISCFDLTFICAYMLEFPSIQYWQQLRSYNFQVLALVYKYCLSKSSFKPYNTEILLLFVVLVVPATFHQSLNDDFHKMISVVI